ncbi:reverse transcriptase [Elysia marginata]|uniref:Reverse transcriptase n=1 Tax=Elysia marginata TaxID=1093978 RepID=A0AAV4JFD2_9GAST|nr:reverse transcriptase [Elysia marginata]
MIQLIPKYRSVLKSVKPVHKTAKIYNEESIGALQACLDCTDWGVFVDSCEDLEELNDVVNHYIQFCEDLTIPKKTITCYPNSKPWITRKLTDAVSRKNKAFRSGNKEELKEASKSINIIVKECKKNYKEKVERNIKTNTRAAWEGMKAMSGCRSKKVGIDVEGYPNKYANDLNKIYARFDVHNFKKETKNVLESIFEERDDECFRVCEKEVENEFRCIKLKKSCGPDGISAYVLKYCGKELCEIFAFMFNWSLKQHCLPKIWKTSDIIPIPKRTPVNELNDLRPVALTPIVTKCLKN